MDYGDVVSFVRDNPVMSLATLDGDQPRVRHCLSVFFDDDLIYFTTGSMKALGRQLQRNRKAELCYSTPDYARMLRITTELEAVDDRAKKQQLIEERGYLKGQSADDPAFMLMRVGNGTAWFWTLADNLKEDTLERVVW